MQLDVLKWLLTFVKKRRGKMLLAISSGVISLVAVGAIPILGTFALIQLIEGHDAMLTFFFTAMILAALIRGFARYLEQYLNHDIAFWLLAEVRDQLYTVLRRLAPAKLKTKQSGKLISSITTDVETLEVFFAHTVSPVAIASIMVVINTLFISYFHWLSGVIVLISYLIIGILIPYYFYQQSKKHGDHYKTAFDALSQQMIEAIEGVSDIKQHHLFDHHEHLIKEQGQALNHQSSLILRKGFKMTSLVGSVILLTTLSVLALTITLALPLANILMVTIATMSSYGAVSAVSGLGNGLVSTLASAKRLYELTLEKPETEDVLDGVDVDYQTLALEHVSFAYSNEGSVLDNFSLQLPHTGIIGIKGPSGVGKSTVLNLMMYHLNTAAGVIKINQKAIERINTSSLRKMEGYMEQATFIFTDTLAHNIAISQPDASLAQIEAAARKASLHDWIISLPDGYDTKVGQHGRSLSDGERQRIGLARLFLHDAPLMLLDEPTSNLDYLNEKIILNALEAEKDKKMLVIVSHRDTTLAIADQVITLS